MVKMIFFKKILKKYWVTGFYWLKPFFLYHVKNVRMFRTLLVKTVLYCFKPDLTGWNQTLLFKNIFYLNNLNNVKIRFSWLKPFFFKDLKNLRMFRILLVKTGFYWLKPLFFNLLKNLMMFRTLLVKIVFYCLNFFF